jgi:hypothetical protein
VRGRFEKGHAVAIEYLSGGGVVRSDVQGEEAIGRGSVVRCGESRDGAREERENGNGKEAILNCGSIFHFDVRTIPWVPMIPAKEMPLRRPYGTPGISYLIRVPHAKARG